MHTLRSEGAARAKGARPPGASEEQAMLLPPEPGGPRPRWHLASAWWY